jgi:hypothetical protein
MIEIKNSTNQGVKMILFPDYPRPFDLRRVRFPLYVSQPRRKAKVKISTDQEPSAAICLTVALKR